MMPRKRILSMLVIALSAGGALAYATHRYVSGVPAPLAKMPTRALVVAASNLQLGSLVKPEDVRVVDWPADSVPEGAIGRPEEAVGRGVIASVVRHEPFLDAKLAPRDSGAGLPPVIPHGMRAVSVRVNEVIGVAGYVLPGTRVDVLATASPTDQREDMTSKLVLSNVQVLAAGTRLDQDDKKGQPLQATVVTLLVTPAEAEKLTLASTDGKIQLALRNPLDQDAPETPGVRPAALLGQAAPPAPRPARPAPRRVVDESPPPLTVEVIRGDKRANEVVQ